MMNLWMALLLPLFFSIHGWMLPFEYADHAIKVLPDGSLLEGKEAIQSYWEQQQSLEVDSTFKLQYTIANRDQSYAYEIGGFTTTDGRQFNHLLIWNLEGIKPLRELEVIAIAEENAPLASQLKEQREAWVSYCNDHEVEKLVKSIYTPDVIYYNHRPPIRGTTAIVKAYGYMKNPEYHLELTPIFIQPVNSEIAFEIGQCAGSYGGKYIFVWQKNQQGTWKVLLDSNI